MTNGPPRLTVRVDPALKREFGPESAWVLRQCLATLGYGWREVDAQNQESCDVLYAERPAPTHALLWIQADLMLWRRARDLRWAGLSTDPCLTVLTPDFAVIGHGGTETVVGRDPLFALYSLATGLEEQHVPRNEHGHLDFAGTAILRDGAFRAATGSAIITAIGKALRRVGVSRPYDPWPDGKRAAFCCGHDVDYPEVVRWLEPIRVLGRHGVHGIANAMRVAAGRKDHWNFGKWADLEQRYGLRSAFYFVARKGSLWQYARSTPDPFYDVRQERFRSVFREIASRGGEIGTHASYWAFTNFQAFRGEKQLLEQLTGSRIVGNRHHYWHLDPSYPEATLLMHERVGYEYDSSLAHERHLGWRRSLCAPFFPFHTVERREIETLQIPTGWMDDQLFGYVGVNRGEPESLLAALVDVACANRGCLMADVHDYVFDADLYPGWRDRYEQLLGMVVSRRDVWLATPAEIAGHWTARYRRLVRASSGLDLGLRSTACGEPRLAPAD